MTNTSPGDGLRNRLLDAALVVKDGKFIYVGDEAGIFTELYVEPGVPHAYEYLEWTPQAYRFFELRNHATERMLGAEKDMKESAEAKAFRELLLKYNIESYLKCLFRGVLLIQGAAGDNRLW